MPLRFEPLPINYRKDIPGPGMSYLDVPKVRDLVLPRIGDTLLQSGAHCITVGEYCNRIEHTLRIKMYMILHRPHTFWSDWTIDRLAQYLGVTPEEIKIPPPCYKITPERFGLRPQDFIHDAFQKLVADELKCKRLTCSEYNEWLARFLDCSARTIYNLRNGTANPSQLLVERIARHFNLDILAFYRN